MNKAIAVVMMVLSVLAFGVATAAVVTVSVPSVAAETSGGCGGAHEPPCCGVTGKPPCP